MIVLVAPNLTATAIQKDKLFVPAIDDGETVWSFGTFYSGRANAVQHAEQIISNLRKSVQTTVKMWSVDNSGPSREN